MMSNLTIPGPLKNEVMLLFWEFQQRYFFGLVTLKLIAKKGHPIIDEEIAVIFFCLLKVLEIDTVKDGRNIFLEG